MGKASKWLKHFLTGTKKKDKEKNGKKPTTLLTGSGLAPFSVPVPKEKRRWSFRRPTATGKDSNSPDPVAPASSHRFSDAEVDKKRHTMAMALAATAAPSRSNAIEETAAIKIQTLFRAYLARKALCALKGLVKLQALVRGHLVRMRAAATLHCMQALITAQARVRVQRIQMLKEAQSSSRWQHNDRRSPQHPRYLQSYEMDKSAGENVKIVEMDLGQTCSSSRSRHSYSGSTDRVRQWNSSYVHYRRQFKMDTRPQVSPSPSTLTDMSPRTYSGRFGELSFAMAQSSPRCLSAASNMHDTPRSSFSTSPHEGTHAVPHGYSFPNYMANTESSRAKARSQSAPKQRPDACERQTSRKRASVEGRNIPRSICMQRSASHVGSAGSMHQCPWSLKVDRSNMSLKDNECDSTSTGLTNTNNCRSVVADTNS